MALDTNITGTNLDAAGNVKVALTNTAAYAGTVRAFAENDPGTITLEPYLKSAEVSQDFRLRVGIDSVLFTDSFNATVQNTNLWAYTFATMTASQPGAGTVNFGTVQGTTSAHGAFMRSWQYFPLMGTAPLSVEFVVGQFTAALVANEVFLFGLGLPSAAVTIPTDGVWIQITSAGVVAFAAYSNTTVDTGVLVPLSSLEVGTTYKFAIVVAEEELEIWMDDVLLGHLTFPATSGQPFQSTALPCFMQKYNTGAVSNTNTMRVSDVTVSRQDIDTGKPWAHQMAGMGANALCPPNGGALGYSTQQAVGAITSGSTTQLPTSVPGSNSTSASGTGFGGWGAINAAAGAATDFICTSFLNLAGTINITGRNLYVTGVRISTINTGAAVATTPTTLLWSIAFGHNSITMNTAESGSFTTATAHAPRRVQLGFQSAPVGSAIGAVYGPDITYAFTTPIVVRPGEYLSTIMKIVVGTATASQTITYNVLFEGYYE